MRFGCTAVGGDLGADVGCLYFVKNTNSVIPVYDLPEEADFYMPAHFLVGSKSAGCPVKAMETELSAIWIPSVERLLVDPSSHVAARDQNNAIGTLASTCVPSTFVRISREIKARRDYEIRKRYASDVSIERFMAAVFRSRAPARNLLLRLEHSRRILTHRLDKRIPHGSF